MSFIPRTARIGSLMLNSRELDRGFDRNASLLFLRVAPQPAVLAVGLADIILDQPLEFLGDAPTLERDGFLSVHVDRRDRTLPGPGEADADIGVLALAGTVDDAAHDRDLHLLDSRVALPPLRHPLTEIALDLFSELLEIGAGGAAAARAGDHHRRERAQAHGLEDFLRDHDLARPVPARLGRERNADRVADSLLKQHPERSGGGHDAFC